MKRTAPIVLVVLVGLLGVQTVAAAEHAVLAGFTATGLDHKEADRARTLVRTALAAAGFELVETLHDPGALAGCGDDGACLARWGREAGVDRVVRASAVRLGDRIGAAVELTRAADGKRQVAATDDLHLGAEHDAPLEAALAAIGPRADRGRARAQRRRRTGWVIAGGAVALAVGGLVAHYEASAAREEFEAHVQPNGDVVDLTPARARALEDRASTWSWVSGALFVAAGAAAAGSAALLLWPAEHVTIVPAGAGGAAIVVGGRF